MEFHISHNGTLYRFFKHTSTPKSANIGTIVKVCPNNFDTKLFKERKMRKLALPQEIIVEILTYTIHEHLCNRNFEEALQLISMTRATITRFYEFYFHNAPLVQKGLFRSCLTNVKHERLSKTLFMMDEIHNHLMIQRNTNFCEYFYVELQADAFNIFNTSIDPWTFIRKAKKGYRSNMELVEMDPTMIATDGNMFHSFLLGKHFADVAWIDGNYCKDRLLAKCYWNPVIPIVIINDQLKSISNPEMMVHYPAWQGFKKLLKQCYGKEVGLFFVESDNEDQFVVHPYE